MSDIVDRLEALQTIRVGLEETCAHLTTQLLAAERRLKEAEAAGAVLIDPLFALGVELQRLRERVAELEEHVRKGDQFIGAVERAEKAESERDAARAEIRRLKSTGDGNEANRAWYEFGVKDGTEFTLVERDTARVERNAAQNNLKLMAEGHDIEMAEMRAERDAAQAQVAELETEKAHILQGLAESTKKRLDVLAQVAVLREALEGVANSVANEHLATDGRFSYAFHDAIKAVEAALAATPAPDILRRVAERVREACARTLFTCSSHTLEEAIEAKLPCAHQRQMTCIRAVDVDAIIKEATRG